MAKGEGGGAGGMAARDGGRPGDGAADDEPDRRPDGAARRAPGAVPAPLPPAARAAAAALPDCSARRRCRQAPRRQPRPTCWRASSRGDLKGKKIGATWRITRAAVDEFLKSPRPARQRRRSRVETVALTKFACPACGGEAQVESGQAERWSARSAAPSRRRSRLDADRRGDDRGARPGRGAARHSATTSAAGRRRRPPVKCQSCQAISVLRPRRASAQRCDFCGSAQLVAYEEVKAAFRPESLLPMKVSETAGARAASAAGMAAAGSRPTGSNAGAHRHGQAASTSPTGPSTPRSHADVDGRDRAITTTTTETYRDANGKTQHAPGAEDPLAAQQRRARPLLRRRTGAAPRAAFTRRCCAASSRFPTNELVPYDAGYSVRLGRRALPDRPRRRGPARARGDGPQGRGAVRAARCRATPTATSACAPTTPARRSSTSWRRCGC